MPSTRKPTAAPGNDEKKTPLPQRGAEDDVQTHVRKEGEPAPRLPHEHDESSDSQQPENEEHTRVGRQAHEDLARGMEDTGTAPVTDRVYNRKVKR